VNPRAAALIAASLAVGCVGYRGGARAIDPGRVATEPGWVVAAATPLVRQEGPDDCGAAALAMVAARWHRPWPRLEVLAALPPPVGAGASLGELRDAARGHRLTAFAIVGDRATLEHEVGAGRPVIVGLLLPYGARWVQPHYEVLVAVRPAADEFVTIDPASGWRTRSWTALDAEWRPAGRPALIVLGPIGR
jgi:ABC-type bacteriocin/lantibiotic exporter with double-glycine peptidase domain